MRPDVDTSQFTVFVVDDDSSICEAICNLLESVGLHADQFGSAEEFLQEWNRSMHGCLVLDVRLPGMTGVEVQQKLDEIGVDLPIIFMTAHGDIPMVRKVMKAGAVEFLTKPFQKEELLDAIQEAVDRDIAHRKEQHSILSVQARLDTLTSREREILEMVTAGLLNKQIAAHLNLSEITVKVHRRQVMEKMQANSLAELVTVFNRTKRASRE